MPTIPTTSTATSIYDRYDEMTDDGPAPLLLLAVSFGMLAAGTGVLGTVVALATFMPTLLAMMPSVLMFMVAAGLLAADYQMRRLR
jgi:hypothetical protein